MRTTGWRGGREAGIATVAGLALIGGLAVGGNWVAARVGGGVPGPVLGMAAYLLLLATGRADWSLRGADLLTGLIGAMIVPALVGLAAFGAVLAPVWWRVAVVLVLSTGLTALAAAGLFRWAGGRG